MIKTLRKPCVVGNWKMNGSKQSNQALVQDLLVGISSLQNIEIEVVLCPPSVYLQQVAELLQLNEQAGIKLGAQNVFYEKEGAFTGEISPDMLRDLGCQYVIIGHSERRQSFSEGDELIARKFVAAYDAGLIPIVCVGETEGERAQGKAFEVVSRQLDAVWKIGGAARFAKSLIAYEPVWAIGTGQTASPEQAEEVHTYLRRWIAERDQHVAQTVRILYGGSIKADNAEQLFSEPNIDGGLVGGASLKLQEFLTICQSAGR